jgi:hypothetical protein
MKTLISKVIGYIVLRYCLFYGALFLISKNVKGLKATDLQRKEDWFMAAWLFLLPVVIECLVLFYPFSYGLDKITGKTNKSWFYLFFLVLFIIEFVLYNNVFGIRYPFLKVGVSIVLFVVLFRKRLFE